jgi:hypothetical protein
LGWDITPLGIEQLQPFPPSSAMKAPAPQSNVLGSARHPGAIEHDASRDPAVGKKASRNPTSVGSARVKNTAVSPPPEPRAGSVCESSLVRCRLSSPHQVSWHCNHLIAADSHAARRPLAIKTKGSLAAASAVSGTGAHFGRFNLFVGCC